MDELYTAERLKAIDEKLEKILHNQVQLYQMFGDIGKILSKYAYTYEDRGRDEAGEARTEQLLHQYGELCHQKVAAEILGCSPRSITRMAERGEIKKIGSQIDVRSICDYLTNGKAKKRKKKTPSTITLGKAFEEASEASVRQARPWKKNSELTPEEIANMNEFERASRGLPKPKKPKKSE